MQDNIGIDFAELTEAQIAMIQEIEARLGPQVCLVAVEKKSVLYVLEAKLAPNDWQRVDQVYEMIPGIKAYSEDFEKAHAAKAGLKTFLINNRLQPKPKKRPIRIRQVIDSQRVVETDAKTGA